MRVILSIGFVVAACGGAFAGTVDVRQVGAGLGAAVKLTHNGNSMDVFAGELTHEFANGTGNGAAFNGLTMNTFCTEVTQMVSTGWSTYDVGDIAGAPVPGPAMGAAKAQAIRNMMAMMLAEIGAGRGGAEVAAGFQVAVWEVANDFDENVGRSSLDFSSGLILISDVGGGALAGGLSSKATMFLDSIGTPGEAFQEVAFTSRQFQDQIIPTPGSAAIVGLAGVMLIRRRRAA